MHLLRLAATDLGTSRVACHPRAMNILYCRDRRVRSCRCALVSAPTQCPRNGFSAITVSLIGAATAISRRPGVHKPCPVVCDRILLCTDWPLTPMFSRLSTPYISLAASAARSWERRSRWWATAAHRRVAGRTAGRRCVPLRPRRRRSSCPRFAARIATHMSTQTRKRPSAEPISMPPLGSLRSTAPDGCTATRPRAPL